MDPKKLRKIIIETIALRNLAGNSIEYIALQIENELKNPQIRRKRIEKEINSMIVSGQLSRTKNGKNYVVTFSSGTQMGTLFVVGKSEGGYIIPFGTNKRVHVDYSICGGFNNGDVVSFVENKAGDIVINGFEKGTGLTNAGVPIEVNKAITGVVLKNETGHYEFYPHDKQRFPNPIVVIGNSTGNNNLEGCLVTGELGNFPGGESVIKITEVLGRVGDPLPETNAIALSCGISLKPNPKIEEELKHIPSQVDVNNYNLTNEDGKVVVGKYDPTKQDYVDLRNKMFTTIDPFDCRDMDDSVYTELDEDGNFVTYSAIADVTEYIKPGSELWNTALKQGFTLYTPYDAYPMLPKVLSHGILSLNPNEDRLTLCCKTVIDKNTGKRIPEKTKIMHAVINSKRKFSYNEVQKICDENNISAVMASISARVKAGENVEPQNLLECVVLNKLCSDAVWKHFKSRDVLHINRNDEKQFVLSEDGKRVLDITPKEHLKSMELIEALMINTNEAIAEFTRDNKLNSVYRVHDQPNLEKVERLAEMMKILGVDFTGNGSNSNLQALIDKTEGTPISDAVKEFVLRTQSKAKYSNKSYPTDKFGNDKTECECHSALKSECYTHFTSGIRRMSDLIVQYAIKEQLRHHKQPFSEEYVAQVAALISSLEIKIEEAERKVNDMHVAIWAEEHINEVLKGKVVGFNGTNVVLENEEKGIRVFVPITDFCKNGRTDDFGLALYDEKGEIVTNLFDKRDFKISGADRVGRAVYASLDLTKTYKNEYAQDEQQSKNGNANSLVEQIRANKHGQKSQATAQNHGQGRSK